MSADGIVAVLIGAGSEIGREVANVLRERDLAIAEWRLYDDAPADTAYDADESGADILPLSEVDLAGADVVFLCGGAAPASVWAPQAASEGALAIDVTHEPADSSDTVLLVPEVNPEALADGVERGLLACPVPCATALAVVLKPLDAAAELKRLVVTALEPASAAGRPGIDELAQQTRDLLSGAGADVDVFPHRIAFNVIPQVGDFVSGGRTRGEWLIESQLRRLLALPDLPIAVSSVLVPAFFGHACSVHVEMERALDATDARALLRQAPGLLLAEEDDPDRYPTLADVIGSEATHVGRVRDDPTVPYGLTLWVAIDGLRKGAAVNAVQIAERALRGRA
jgi:aspartate-semialdehyde dehydrogenase